MNVDINVTHVRADGIRHLPPYGYKPEAGWPCDIWSVTLTYQGRSYTTEYRTGIRHRRAAREYYRDHRSVKIEARDVLAWLFYDANAGHETFEEWCEDLGFDSDSRHALNTYLQCQQTATALRRLFGADYAQAEEWCRDA